MKLTVKIAPRCILESQVESFANDLRNMEEMLPTVGQILRYSSTSKKWHTMLNRDAEIIATNLRKSTRLCIEASYNK